MVSYRLARLRLRCLSSSFHGKEIFDLRLLAIILGKFPTRHFIRTPATVGRFGDGSLLRCYVFSFQSAKIHRAHKNTLILINRTQYTNSYFLRDACPVFNFSFAHVDFSRAHADLAHFYIVRNVLGIYRREIGTSRSPSK